MDQVYPGKVMLLGEYAVIGGSSALAVPNFQCTAKVAADIPNWSSPLNVEEFLGYLDRKNLESELNGVLDISQFRSDLKNGLGIHSDIPIGMGMGSSGAVTALIYDRYQVGSEDRSIQQIKRHLAVIESYFHGASSGLDPLVSLIKKPVLIRPDGTADVVQNRFSIVEAFPFDR